MKSTSATTRKKASASSTKPSAALAARLAALVDKKDVMPAKKPVHAKLKALAEKQPREKAPPPKRVAFEELEYVSAPAKDWTPHRYQERAVKWLLENAGAALFLDPGLGKTSITLAAKKVLMKRGMTGKTLVIAPLRICYTVWPKEVKKWKDFENIKVDVLHGAKREERLWNSDADVLCINPEGLEWLLGVHKVKTPAGKTRVEVDIKRVRKLFDDLNITDLVVDESTKFKNGQSQRSKMLREILHRFQRRWILTGTPAPNSMMDLFGQIYIVDMGRALGQFITHYRSTYFESFGFGGYSYRLKYGADKLIYKKLKKIVLRLDANDYLELPERVENVIKFDLPEEAREIYDALEGDLAAEVAGGIVTALNTAAAMTKCEQVANGGLYRQKDPLIGGGGRDGWTLIHHEKDEIVEDLVAEMNGQPVLIAYGFGHDLERLLKVFGKDTPVLGGGTSMKKTSQIELAWNRGQIPVLLAHPASAGHGLNLQEASDAPVGHIIFYGLTHDYELFDQFIRRVLRQGSKHKRVIVHLICARNTVDEAKLYSMRRKAKGQTSMLDALRVYVASRGGPNRLAGRTPASASRGRGAATPAASLPGRRGGRPAEPARPAKGPGRRGRAGV